MKKYGALLLFSLVTALIVLALYRNSNPNSKLNFWTAVALGIGWEATLEKSSLRSRRRHRLSDWTRRHDATRLRGLWQGDGWRR